MGGDYSRERFDATKDFLALLLQQGRVLCEADVNELVRVIDRRMRAQVGDTIGRCTVPRETPDAFRISVVDNALTIGRGRIYVDGLLAENHGKGAAQFDTYLAEEYGATALGYAEQPYLPNAAATSVPAEGGPHLVYVVVWPRELTWLERPDLVESAIGQDTVTALQSAWQVRVLPNVGAGVTCATPDGQIPAWDALIRPSAGRLSTSVLAVAEEEDPCITAADGGGFTGLQYQLYRFEIHKGGPIGTATYKWSRDNASVAAAVLTLDGTRLGVTRVGRDAVLRFNPGDWIEITDDWRELAGEPGELCKIRSVVEGTQTIEIETALPAAAFPVDAEHKLSPERHTRVRKWDHRGDTGELPVPAAGTAVAIENGLHVTFDVSVAGGEFKSGDYWTCAARATDASVESLVKAPPRGVHRHYGRLAVVTFPNVTDCRVLWPPQVQTQPVPEPEVDRGIRVRHVQLLTGEELVNDKEVPARLLSRGIQVHLTDAIDPRAVLKRPTCYVGLELPYPLNDADRQLWHGLPIGYERIYLEGIVEFVENIINWRPADSVVRWMTGPLFPELDRHNLAAPLLARLTLKGNFIWGRAHEDRPSYLDGDAFADPRGGLVFPSGDERRGGDFETWFWVVRG